MIKTILVPTSGNDSDEAVFATAFAAAKPGAAHLQFYHVRVLENVATVRTPHLDFCTGAGLVQALEEVRHKVETLSTQAAAHVKTYCAKQGLMLHERPGSIDAVTASYVEEENDAGERLLMLARHSDLAVLGRRAGHVDYMSGAFLEDLLVASGRPVIIAPAHPRPTNLFRTIVIGWKECAESARALAAARPYLRKAVKVILLHVVEDDASQSNTLAHLAQYLEWHGVNAEARVVPSGKHGVATQLLYEAADLGADLLVVGAFGHSRVRELVFGGVTQSLIDAADIPVFMTC